MRMREKEQRTMATEAMIKKKEEEAREEAEGAIEVIEAVIEETVEVTEEIEEAMEEADTKEKENTEKTESIESIENLENIENTKKRGLKVEKRESTMKENPKLREKTEAAKAEEHPPYATTAMRLGTFPESVQRRRSPSIEMVKEGAIEEEAIEAVEEIEVPEVEEAEEGTEVGIGGEETMTRSLRKKRRSRDKPWRNSRLSRRQHQQVS